VRHRRDQQFRESPITKLGWNRPARVIGPQRQPASACHHVQNRATRQTAKEIGCALEMPHENLLTWLPEHHAAEDLWMEPPQVESYQVNRHPFSAKEKAEPAK
jgi:hypothetical protein